MLLLVGLLLGLLLGAAGAWLWARGRTAALEVELVHERSRMEEKVALLDQFGEKFDALAADALRKNNESFLELAGGKVRPIEEHLKKVTDEVQALERSRRQDYGMLQKSVETLVQSNERIRAEAASLSTALRSSEVRGAWGQMALRNAVETAGMLAYCDFVEQATTTSEDGVLRPDVVVRFAGGKQIVIDAKVPLEALLDIADADDDAAREEHYRSFLRHVRTHVAKLSLKSYWQQFDRSPEFVVMYLPSEAFYRYALEKDDALMEAAASQNVVLAGPMNLIGLLKIIALGWREEALAESAAHVSELGRDLYTRLATMGKHFSDLGRRLTSAVETYNDTVSSLETRVLPSARRFPELGVPSEREIEPLAQIEKLVKPLTAPELVPLAGFEDLDVDAA